MRETKFGSIKFERRIFPRFSFQVPFTYQCDLRVEGEGITQDASQGGMQVFLPEEIAPQAILTLTLTLPKGTETKQIKMTARVVWIMRTETSAPNYYKAGLKFMSSSPEGLKYFKRFQELWLQQAG